jgi:hypothetical protein
MYDNVLYRTVNIACRNQVVEEGHKGPASAVFTMHPADSGRKSGSFEGSSSAGIDPLLPFKIGPMNGRDARESGLSLQRQYGSLGHSRVFEVDSLTCRMLKSIELRRETDSDIVRPSCSTMNVSNALALSFAVSLACSAACDAAEDPSPSHAVRRHPHQHHQVTTARRLLAAQAPSLEPFVINDSDGMSRDPGDCNKGCLDSSE